VEAELGALFLNYKEGMIFCLTLEELDHPQQKTPIHCNNATAVGIANNTVKRQRSHSMETRYFWVCDKVAQDAYDVKWHPRKENLANYQSKHHPGAHHTAVRPWYLHEDNSPLILPRASRPSTLKLEPYPKGMYVTYPYLGSQCDRVLVLIRYTRYLITTKYRMEFLHPILHIA